MMGKLGSAGNLLYNLVKGDCRFLRGDLSPVSALKDRVDSCLN